MGRSSALDFAGSTFRDTFVFLTLHAQTASMEYEKCYVFEPEHPRPTKRRRVESQGLQSSSVVRHEAYRKGWKAQQRRIDVRLQQNLPDKEMLTKARTD